MPLPDFAMMLRPLQATAEDAQKSAVIQDAQSDPMNLARKAVGQSILKLIQQAQANPGSVDPALLQEAIDIATGRNKQERVNTEWDTRLKAAGGDPQKAIQQNFAEGVARDAAKAQARPEPRELTQTITSQLKAMGVDPKTATPEQITSAQEKIQERLMDQSAARTENYLKTKEQIDIADEVRKMSGDLNSAEALITEIEAASKKVNTFGPTGRVLEYPIRQGESMAQSNPDIIALRNKAGLLANIARGLGGERGVLTNQDIGRAELLVPSINDTQEVAQNKLRDLRSIIERGRANLRLKSQQGALGPYQQIPMSANDVSPPRQGDEVAAGTDTVASPPGVQLHQHLPPASQYPGKMATDTESGMKYRSDGQNWIPVR